MSLTVLAALCILGVTGAAVAKNDGPVKLNVLFIGAHPDDEAFTIPAFGQWAEDHGLSTGVVTITRGEGGGNAVGPEEGPALGILREGEERRAVGKAGIDDIFYLDTVDFYYTVSAPLTEQIWGHDTTLERVVRLVRETKPDVIVTMDPSPSPGNHGNHQYAARLATEAFYAAADPSRFKDQLEDEHLDTWDVKRLFRGGASGSGPSGSDCASTFVKSEPTDDVFGVWMGTPSAANGGLPWWHILWDAAHEYLSQGFGAFPSPPDLPFIIPCNTFTQIASRVPFDATSTATTAMFQGASIPAPGGLPLGTELSLTSDRFDVAAGTPFHVTAHGHAEKNGPSKGTVTLSLPAGWTATGDGELKGLQGGKESTTTFTVTPSASAAAGRQRIAATLSAEGATGQTDLVVRVAPAVRGTVQRLPQVAQFEQWARDTGVPQLGGLVKPVLSIGTGETRAVRVDLHNGSGQAQSGSVSLTLPAGFSATPASRPYSALAANGDTSVSFDVTNTNPALPTSNQGGTNGDYDSTVTTTSGAGSSSETFGLELVPVTAIPQAPAAPVVNGVEGAGEYPGPALDLSRLWEGSPCDSAADCSGTAKVAWRGDDVYFLVRVQRRRARDEGRADRLQAPLAHRLGRDRARPARPVGEHGHDVQDGHLPDHERPRPRQPAVLRARRRQPPGRPRDGARDAGRLDRERALLRLHARGEDPARRPPVGGRPGPPGAEHLHLRLRHAGPDGPDAARLVDLRRRPGRPVPLGPRHPAGLHAAGRPPDHAVGPGDRADGGAQRRLAAVDPAVGDGQRPARRRHRRGREQRGQARPAAEADCRGPDARHQGEERRPRARVRLDGNRERRRRRRDAPEGEDDDRDGAALARPPAPRCRRAGRCSSRSPRTRAARRASRRRCTSAYATSGVRPLRRAHPGYAGVSACRSSATRKSSIRPRCSTPSTSDVFCPVRVSLTKTCRPSL